MWSLFELYDEKKCHRKRTIIGQSKFASTLPKPHKPKLQPKLCQKASKANTQQEIVLNNLPTLKKTKKADTQADYNASKQINNETKTQ